jgi:hypothetical protein
MNASMGSNRPVVLQPAFSSIPSISPTLTEAAYTPLGNKPLQLLFKRYFHSIAEPTQVLEHSWTALVP